MPRRDEEFPRVRCELADDPVVGAHVPQHGPALGKVRLGGGVHLLRVLVHRVQGGVVRRDAIVLGVILGRLQRIVSSVVVDAVLARPLEAGSFDWARKATFGGGFVLLKRFRIRCLLVVFISYFCINKDFKLIVNVL